MCPPSRSPSRNARSRLTRCPTSHRPIVVRSRVVTTAAAENHPAPCSRTVRHAPFTEMLSPVASPMYRDRTRSSRPASVCSIRSTTPTSSISPVNIQIAPPSSAGRGVDRHLVVPEALGPEKTPSGGVSRAGRRHRSKGVQRAAAEDEGCPKDNQAIDQRLLDQRRRERRTTFDEHGAHAALAQGDERVARRGGVE